MEYSVNVVEQAILAAFSGRNAAEANTYLREFSETPEAWKISAQLFHSDSEIVQYFASNILYTKVRKQSHQLDDKLRNDVGEFLQQYLLSAKDSIREGTRKVLLSRVALALLNLYARFPGGLHTFINLCFGLIQTLKQPQDTLGLELLGMIPEEVAEMDVSRSLRNDLDADLETLLPRIVSLLSAIGSLPEADCPREIILGTQQLLTGWVGRGISLVTLFVDVPSIGKLFCSSLASSEAILVRQSCAVLLKLLELDEYPRSRHRDPAIMQITTALVTSQERLLGFFGSDGDEETAFAITSAVTTLVSVEASLLVGEENCSGEFLNFMLACTAARPRRVASLIADAWLAIQDIPVSERAPITQGDGLFTALVRAILSQCQYPQDDDEDFVYFRDRRYGAPEVVCGCLYVLKDAFFSTLGAELQQAISRNPSDSGCGWETVEAVLLLVIFVADVLKSSSQISDSICAKSFLEALIKHLRSYPKQFLMNRGELVETISLFLGAVSTIPSMIAMDGFFLPTLEFLYELAFLSPSGKARQSAAKSFNQLCITGAATLISPQVQISGINSTQLFVIDVFVDKASKDILQWTRNGSFDVSIPQTILEALGRIVVQLHPTEASDRIRRLVVPFLTEGMIVEVPETCDGFQRLAMFVHLIIQTLRICDATSSASKASCLETLLSLVEPKIDMIENMITSAHSVPPEQYALFACIIEKLFEFYSCVGRNGAISKVLNRWHQVHRLLSMTIQGRDKVAVAGMSCATSLTEELVKLDDRGNGYVAKLVESTLIAVLGLAKSNGDIGGFIEKCDPDFIEKYFSLMLTCQHLCPTAFMHFAEHASDLFMFGLHCLQRNNEFTVRRVILQVMQQPFEQGVDGNQGTEEVARARDFLLKIIAGYSDQIISYIFTCLTGSLSTPSMQWSLLVETAYNIASSANEPQILLQQCIQKVFEESISIAQASFVREEISFVADRLGFFCLHNKRMFKALALDIAKICHGEQSKDCLVTYTDVTL